jgi:glycosyltransferase involved in cell wall biosynthesis
LETRVLRIAVHDFVGHPFQFELTRELAANGHIARHFFFSDYPGPKGDAQVRNADPAGYSVEPISLNRPYSTAKFVKRGLSNLRYGAVASRRIGEFNPDVVLSGNTPIEAQGQLQRTAHLAGAAFVFWMQDFYSLAVKTLASGRIPLVGGLIGNVYHHMEGRQLRASEEIVLISEGFRSELGAFRLDESRINVIPNWGALSELPCRPRHNDWSRANGLNERFVLLYSGTLGMKHNPTLLLELADAFVDDAEVEIVVACAGSGADLLSRALTYAPRANLRMLPLQPIDQFPDVLGSADVMIGLLESDAGRFSIPSKVLSYLCAGRAVLLSAPEQNLAAQTVREAEAGLVVGASDPAAFVNAAKRLRADTALRQRFASAGWAYAQAHFAIPKVAQRFISVLERAIARRR